jgi:3-hydroxybutyryl-CoA dehydrogenase
MSSGAVGVVGAGVMGAGIALALARGGIETVLVDVDEDRLQAAIARIGNEMRLKRLFAPAKERNRYSSKDIADRIRLQVGLNGFENLGFVIETVPESLLVKTEVYKALSAVCDKDCVLASNTSAIPITQLAALTTVPENVVGIHFMNPVTMGDYVELVRGRLSADSALDAAKELLSSIGKKWVLVNDGPGFVTNRILMVTINEAIWAFQDGVASAADIDQLFRSCFGHKMGPLETADLIGLDVILSSIMVLYDSFNDCKYRPCPLLKQMVQAGLFGRKSGEGFYSYKEN